MKKIFDTIKECVEFLKMDFSLKTKGYYIENKKETKKIFDAEKKPLTEKDMLMEYSNLINFSTAL